MPTQTTNYGFSKPLVNNAVDQDLWGTQLNTNLDTLDTLLGARTASKYGAIIVQNATDNGFDTVTSQGTAGQVLTSNGDDALPSFQATAGISAAYPVGSIYMNRTVSTNPATLLGFGTWVALTDTFIVAHGSTYTTTGGAATVTLSQSNIPSFNLSVSTYANLNNGSNIRMADTTGVAGTASISSGGSSTAFSIIPPYTAVYVWERTV